ncbi:ac111 [Sucra jujuba nucleopolyhedrovirus]|uniref:Ac111 n=1 Tax=Sucra jujuba nucleopolyhedrovirus TaxID=1563660 RepID=A0A097P958_9ABAC|nr:ac111 [Sucra jujuba nucleopolyhedrovirus]AIU41353.1 ac111 [Sucra jujuba nucleopolyhedrovirus]
MDMHSANKFYNYNRKPLRPTTLHDGNLPQSTYRDVSFLRKMICTEIPPNRQDDKFKTEGYNKENRNYR